MMTGWGCNGEVRAAAAAAAVRCQRLGCRACVAPRRRRRRRPVQRWGGAVAAAGAMSGAAAAAAHRAVMAMGGAAVAAAAAGAAGVRRRRPPGPARGLWAAQELCSTSCSAPARWRREH
jgi:hypothetical protein